MKQGNRYILVGTLVARGLLCWGMAGAALRGDAVTLLPAALGVLVLQKAYGVTRAAVTPRLLPSEITLVTANSRSNLASIIAASTGAVIALGIDKIAGDHGGGAAWVLWFATAIYLAAAIFGLRLTHNVDATADEEQAAAGIPAREMHAGNGADPASAGSRRGPGGTWEFEVDDAPDGKTARAKSLGRTAQPGATPGSTTSGAPARLRRMFTPPKLGPVVSEAMQANAAIRIFYGFLLFFLAFILRSEEFGHRPHFTSHAVALGGFAAAIAVGGVLGTVIGSALKARAPLFMMFTILGLATLVSIACAMFFGLWSIFAIALAAAISQTLVKAGLDSILQRDIPPEKRASTFAFSETVHQLALVGGGLIGLLLSLTGSGFAGLTLAAICLALALCWLIASRRRRVIRARRTSPGPVL